VRGDLRRFAASLSPAERAEVRREISLSGWAEGDLSYKLRPHGQTRLYSAVEEHVRRTEGQGLKPFMALCHRRFGKSYAAAVYLVGRAVKQPGAILKFACPTRLQVKSIISPILHSIFEDAPPWIHVRTSGNTWEISSDRWGPGRWASTIEAVGVDWRSGDPLRGSACDAAVLDEVRDIRHLSYIVSSILVPQFVGRSEPLLLLLTTPPRDLDHDSCKVYWERARRDGSGLRIPGSENDDWSAEDDLLVREELQAHGDSEQYLREVECVMVPDTSTLAVPEFSANRANIVTSEPHPRPPKYIPYVSLDLGFKDHTGVLFGYIDFEDQRLVVVDELFVNYRNQRELSVIIKRQFHRAFPKHIREEFPGRWLADADPMALANFESYDLHFQRAEKHDAATSLARFRAALQRGSVVIEEKNCPELCYQLAHGQKSPRKGELFSRSGRLGHCDLIAAALYLWRGAIFTENPYPPTELIRRSGRMLIPSLLTERDSDIDVLGEIFSNE
tara:strand:+ start:440 stop:1948 length:1509 start_codon:yes stop_codon:yes gene_type:complete